MESAEGDGWGRARRRDVNRGMRGAIADGSGGMLRGDRRGWARVWRRRLWWVSWVVRAVWAVTSLWSRVSSDNWTRSIKRGREAKAHRVVLLSTSVWEPRSLSDSDTVLHISSASEFVLC